MGTLLEGYRKQNQIGQSREEASYKVAQKLFPNSTEIEEYEARVAAREKAEKEAQAAAKAEEKSTAKSAAKKVGSNLATGGNTGGTMAAGATQGKAATATETESASDKIKALTEKRDKLSKTLLSTDSKAKPTTAAYIRQAIQDVTDELAKLGGGEKTATQVFYEDELAPVLKKNTIQDRNYQGALAESESAKRKVAESERVAEVQASKAAARGLSDTTDPTDAERVAKAVAQGKAAPEEEAFSLAKNRVENKEAVAAAREKVAGLETVLSEIGAQRDKVARRDWINKGVAESVTMKFVGGLYERYAGQLEDAKAALMQAEEQGKGLDALYQAQLLRNRPGFSELAQKGKTAQVPDDLKLSRMTMEGVTVQLGAPTGASEDELAAHNTGLEAQMTEAQKQTFYAFLGAGRYDDARAYLAALDTELRAKSAQKLAALLWSDERYTNLLGIAVNPGFARYTNLLGFTAAANAQNYFHNVRQLGSTTQLADPVAKQAADAFLQQYTGGPKLVDRTLPQMGLEAAANLGNMLPSMAIGATTGVGGLGAALLGVGAAGGAYSEGLSMGYSVDEASRYATLTGASEAGLEYLLGGFASLGGKVTGLTKEALVASVKSALGRTAVEMGIEAFGEFSEEYLQEILTPVFKNVCFGENNEIRLFTSEALYAGIQGALLSFIMEGPGNAVGAATDQLQRQQGDRAVGAILRESGAYAEALALATAQGGRAAQLADNLQSGKTAPTDKNIGRLPYAYRDAGGDMSPIFAAIDARIEGGVVSDTASEGEITAKVEEFRARDAAFEAATRERVAAEQSANAEELSANAEEISENADLRDEQRFPEREEAAERTESTPEAFRAAQEEITSPYARDLAGGRTGGAGARETAPVDIAEETAPVDIAEETAKRSVARERGKRSVAASVKADAGAADTSIGSKRARMEDGTELQLEGLYGVEAGGVYLSSEQGAVKLDDIEMEDAALQYVYGAAEGKDIVFAVSISDAFIAQRESGMGVADVAAWTNAFQSVARAAQKGLSAKDIRGAFSFDSVLSTASFDAAMGYGAIIREVAQEQSKEKTAQREAEQDEAKTARDASKEEAKRQRKAEEKAQKDAAARAKPGLVRRDTVAKLTPEQKGQLAVLDAIAKKYGLRVITANKLFTKREDTLVQLNGQFDPKTGEIRVAMDADEGALLYVGCHELVHYLKQYNANGYKALEDYVVAKLTEQGRDVEAMITEYSFMGEERSAEKLDELVANTVPAFLSDAEIAGEFVAKEGKLAKRIASFFERFAKALDELVEKLAGHESWETLAGAKKDRDMLGQMARLMREGLEGASFGNHPSTGIDLNERTKYSEKDSSLPKTTAPQDVAAVNTSIRDSSENDAPIAQAISSEKTSLAQVPALFKDKNAQFGTVNIDIGGGRYDLATNFLADRGTKNLPFDPYNRTEGENRASLAFLQAGNRGDTATVANVLNVIAEEDARANVILEAARSIKAGGTAYFTVYEGDGSGNARATSAGWQNNRKTADYVSEIERYFDTVVRKGKLIIATDPIANLPKAAWEVAPGNAVRFSLKDTAPLKPATSTAEVARLQKQLDLLKREFTLTRGFTPKPEAVERLAKTFLREIKSDYSPDTFRDNLEVAGQAIHNDPDNAEAIVEAFAGAVNGAMEQSRARYDPLAEDRAELRATLKGRSVYFDNGLQSEVARAYGSFGAYRRAMFGTFNPTASDRSALGIDELWGELSERWPGYFDADTAEGDMPLQLVEVLGALEPQYQSVEGLLEELMLPRGDAARALAEDLLGRYAELAPLPPTFADKKKAELDKLRADKNAAKKKALDELRDSYKAELKRLQKKRLDDIKALTEKLNARNDLNKDVLRARIKALRDEKNAKFDAMRASYIARIEADRVARKSRGALAKITREADTLTQWLAKPTSEHHVPDRLKLVTTSFLSALELSSKELNRAGQPTRWTQLWAERLDMLRKALTKLEGDAERYGGSFNPDFAPGLQERMDDFVTAHKHERVSGMDEDALSELAWITRALRVGISKENKAHAQARNVQISALARSTMGDFAAKAARKNLGWLGNTARSIVTTEQMDSFSFFHALGETAEQVFAPLRAGLDKRTFWLAETGERMAEVMKGVNTKGWSGANATLRQFEFDGRSLTMTPAQVMNLYVLNGREQARGHIYSDRGGIIMSSARTGIDDYTIFTLNEAQVEEIVATLTDEQKRVADAMQRYLEGEAARWGNEVSQELYEYDAFGEQGYWPIKSYQGGTDTKTQDSGAAAGLYALKNLGMTKATQQHASNAIVVGDVFDVFAGHVSEMAAYGAFVVPLTDMLKWYNYRDGNASVKNGLQRILGKDGLEWMTQFLQDVNGTPVDRGSPWDRLMGNAKLAAVGANLRVIVQQPTAIARAASMIDPKYLLQGAIKTGGMERMEKYCGIAKWKSMGFLETGLGPSLKSVVLGQKTAMETTREWVTKGAERADRITWGVLWQACEAETRAKRGDLVDGTEDFYRVVAARMSEIVDKTQVVDSVFHRPQIMRRGAATKYLTAFMSEPIKTYNLMRNAVLDAAERRSRESLIQLARTTTAVAASMALNALAQSLIDGLRDDDDDERLSKWAQYWKGFADSYFPNLLDNMNPFAMIPGVSSVVSMLQGYDEARIDMQGLDRLITATRSVYGKITGADTQASWYKLAYNLVNGMSSVLGVPVANLWRDLEDIYLSVTPDDLWRPQQRITLGSRYADMMTALGAGDEAAYARARAGLTKTEAELQAGIRNALLWGDVNEKSRMEARLKAEGLEGKALYDALRESVAWGDERIRQAMEARIEGDTGEYERLVDELVKAGYERDTVIDAVKAALDYQLDGRVDAPKEEKAASLYANSDLQRAVLGAETQTAKHIVEVWRAEGKADGTIKAAATAAAKEEYRTAYAAGDTKRIEALAATLKALGLGYTDEDMFAWVFGEKYDSATAAYASMVAARKSGDTTAYEAAYADLRTWGKEYADIDTGLKQALVWADSRERDRLMKLYQSEGMTGKDLYDRVRDEVGYGDERVGAAADARRKGDFETYERLVEDMVKEGWKRDVVLGAVQSDFDYKRDDREEKADVDADGKRLLYQTKDAVESVVDRYDAEGAKRVLEALVAAGRSEDGIKSGITEEAKKRYLEAVKSGDRQTMGKLEATLKALGLGYDEEVFTGWVMTDRYGSKSSAYAGLSKAISSGRDGDADEIMADLREWGTSYNDIDSGVRDALLWGDESEKNRLLAALKEAGYEGQGLYDEVRKRIAYGDKRIEEAVAARQGGRYEEYERLVADMERDGYKHDVVVSAVNAALDYGYKEPSADVDEDNTAGLYRLKDIYTALDKGNADDASYVLGQIAEAKGKSYSDYSGTAKGEITKHYKVIYKDANKAGNEERMREIERALLALPLKNRYTMANIRAWAK